MLQVAANRCSIVAGSSEATVRTAVRVLQTAIAGPKEGTGGDVTLRLLVAPDDVELLGLRNAGQAYRIRPLVGGERGLELAGTSVVSMPAGVWYSLCKTGNDSPGRCSSHTFVSTPGGRRTGKPRKSGWFGR